MSFSVHHITRFMMLMSSYVIVDLDCLVNVVSAGFLYCKITIFPCVTNKYLGEKPWDYANPISLQISATNFRVHQWVSFATINISVHSRIFILVSGLCGVLLILSLKLFQLWSLGAPSSWLLSFGNFLSFFFILYIFTRCSLLSITTNCSRFVLYVISLFVGWFEWVKTTDQS